MPSRVLAAGFGLAVAAMLGAGMPASATTLVKPRAGTFAGTESGPGNGSTVSFVVTTNRKVIRKFTGNATVKAGCKGPYAGYEAPTGPMAITKRGTFTKSTTAYPGPKLRVTVTGRFTSPTTASGRVVVRFKRLKGCNATIPFSVVRTKPMAGSPG
jgi:hypothetical protein